MKHLVKYAIVAMLLAGCTLQAQDRPPQKDIKQLGQERTACYNAAMKKFALDKLLQKLIAEEADLGKLAAAAKKAGNAELAAILGHAQSGKHMEKRYYLCLLDPTFKTACQAYNDADPGFVGLKSTELTAESAPK